MSDLPRDAMIMLGRIEQMAIDLREDVRELKTNTSRLGDRTGAIERQMMTRHKENSDRLELLQAGQEGIKSAFELIKSAFTAIEVRLTVVEKPAVETIDRKVHRRKWIMRGVQIISGAVATLMIFVEPAGKVVIEFYTRRFIDRP